MNAGEQVQVNESERSLRMRARARPLLSSLWKTRMCRDVHLRSPDAKLALTQGNHPICADDARSPGAHHG